MCVKAALNQLKSEFYALGIILFRAILSDFKLVAQRQALPKWVAIQWKRLTSKVNGLHRGGL